MVKEEKGENVLLFNASSCVGCLVCKYACPEKVLSVQKSFYLIQIAEDLWWIKAVGEVVRCRRCGRPVATRKTINKVMTTLQMHGFKESLEWMFLCTDCKGLPPSANARLKPQKTEVKANLKWSVLRSTLRPSLSSLRTGAIKSRSLIM